MSEMSQEEKDEQINRIKGVFEDIRNLMLVLETDMVSTKLIEQGSAIWISAQFCSWYMDFRRELAKLDQSQAALDNLQNEVKEAASDSANLH
jgi:hypothetical protein